MTLELIKNNLPYFNERPEKTVIDTIIIHSMYAKARPAKFNPENCIAVLAESCVASHYVVSRTGDVYCLVGEDKRAWHAGVSKLPYHDDDRDNVNNFSIGIELIGSEDSGFTKEQYSSLCHLTADIMSRHPIKYLLGHEHVAPNRKIDPGPAFSWERYAQMLTNLACDISGIKFGL